MGKETKIDCLKEALSMCDCLNNAIIRGDNIEHQLHDIIRIKNWILMEMDRRNYNGTEKGV